MSNFNPVLVCVDDEPGILEHLKDILAHEDYEIELFEHVTMAVDFIEKRRGDVFGIFADYKMPNIDGLEFKKILNEKGLSDIVYGMITGHYDKNLAVAGMELGISKFLEKPIIEDETLEFFNNKILPRKMDLEEKFILTLTFLEESEEIIQELEPLILEIESRPTDSSLINSIFRLVHTVKGGSGVLERPEVTKYFHKFEEILTGIKDGKISVDQKVVSLLLVAFDEMKNIIEKLKTNTFVQLNLEDWTKTFENAVSGKFDDAKVGKGGNNNPVKDKAKTDINVPIKLLNEFMELSGEITVIRNMINKLVVTIAAKVTDKKEIGILWELLEEMHKINAQMQSKIVELRKVPLSNVYRPLVRAMRDSSRALNKDIEFIINGDDLKVDTSIGHVLSSSLVHMVRNCADHGIESNDEREKNGKPRQGHVTLESVQKGEEVVITLTDDGGGINPDIIKKKCVEKNLFSEEELNKMTRKNILSMIFHPGFSTAAEVTDISGRGVGMDMVRSSVEAANGKIDTESEMGKGTKFTITLPVPKSVLIINSLIINVSNRLFALPQDMVTRLLLIEVNKKEQFFKSVEGGIALLVNDNLLPLVHLGDVLDLTDEDFDITEYIFQEDRNINIAIVKSDNLEFAVVLDSVEGSEDIVVKKPAQVVMNQNIYAGATFMGDGTVGLVLDVEGVAQKANILSGEDAETHEYEEVETNISKEVQEYLLVDICNGTTYAIELKDVFRLENPEPKVIKTLAGKAAIPYRGEVLPIIDLSFSLGLEGLLKDTERESYQMLVLNHNGGKFGFIVNEIKDVLRTAVSLDESIRDREEIKGNITTKKCNYPVISPRDVIKNAGFNIDELSSDVLEKTENLRFAEGV